MHEIDDYYGHRWLVVPEYISLQRCRNKLVSCSPEEFDVEYQTVPSATTTFTTSLISALLFLQISALPKLDNVGPALSNFVGGAEINSLCRHDSYRPYKNNRKYIRSWLDSRTFIYGQKPL